MKGLRMKVLTGQYYQALRDTIVVPRGRLDLTGLLSALHEQGHVACGHSVDDYAEWVTIDRVLIECEAWSWARRCVQDRYLDAFDARALECVRTYNGMCEAETGEWLDDAEILDHIRRE